MMKIFSCKSCVQMEKVIQLLRGQLADKDEFHIAREKEFRQERKDLLDRILVTSKPGAFTELTRPEKNKSTGLHHPPTAIAKFPGTQSSITTLIDPQRLKAIHGYGKTVGMKGEVIEPENQILDAINRAAQASNLKPV